MAGASASYCPSYLGTQCYCTVTADAIAITAIAHPPAQNHWYKLPTTAARQSVLRLVGKGRWRNEDRLRAAFGQAMQHRVEGWESALPMFVKQLLEMDKRSTAKAEKARPPPRFPIAH